MVSSSPFSFDSKGMEMFFLKATISITLSTLMLLSSPCYADTNQIIDWVCSGSDNTTIETEYQTNLNNLLNSLAANGPNQNGFYTATAGKDTDKIYGLTQCRGDISVKDCTNCIKNSTLVRGCSNSKNVTIWLRWCFLRYSNVSFFGVWDQSGKAVDNDTDFDDPNVVSEGLNFMNGIASTAPKQPLMFQTAVLDVRQSGKRYGMAQCTRDISESDCGECLDYQLVTFRTTIGNKRGWEIYGSSCSLWYHDYHFYFNISTLANEGATRFSPNRAAAAIGMIIPMLVLLSVL